MSDELDGTVEMQAAADKRTSRNRVKRHRKKRPAPRYRPTIQASPNVKPTLVGRAYLIKGMASQHAKIPHPRNVLRKIARLSNMNPVTSKHLHQIWQLATSPCKRPRHRLALIDERIQIVEAKEGPQYAGVQ